MNYAITILNLIPNVTFVESSLHDSCCGGGGLVARHAPDVSRKIVEDNVSAIKETGATQVVAPCPLCTAQLEENLFREGESTEVDDLTVFIAQRISKE